MNGSNFDLNGWNSDLIGKGQFQKICQRVECRNQKIGLDWSRQSQKRFLLTQVSLQKVSSRLVTQKILISPELQ